jgi:hypothetical protein
VKVNGVNFRGERECVQYNTVGSSAVQSRSSWRVSRQLGGAMVEIRDGRSKREASA